MGSHRHMGGLSWGPVYMSKVTVDPCGHYRGGKKFCGHCRDRWGELWAPWGTGVGVLCRGHPVATPGWAWGPVDTEGECDIYGYLG